MEDFGALAVILFIVGVFAFTQAPRHWQTPLGYTIGLLLLMPLALIAVAALASPYILVPATLIIALCLTVKKPRGA